MDKLTLDTNILRDWAWCEEKSAEQRYNNDHEIKRKLKGFFKRLSELRDNNICELGFTTQLYRDFAKTDGDLPKHIEEIIGLYTTLATPSLPILPFVLPIVLTNGNDYDEIFEIVFPNVKKSSKEYHNCNIDTLLIWSHKIAGRDFFLTNDKIILRATQNLEIKLKIRVINLENYLDKYGEK